MKNKIIEEVKRLCLVAKVPYVESRFTLKSKTAGTFNYKGKTCELNFNLIFAENHPDEYLTSTVPHEVAHYVRYVRNGFVHDMNGKTRDCHGAKWSAVMIELGATDASRCHKYDTSSIATRKYKRFSYSCDAGHSYELTTIRHNRSQKGMMWYNCRECGSRLYFRG